MGAPSNSFFFLGGGPYQFLIRGPRGSWEFLGVSSFEPHRSYQDGQIGSDFSSIRFLLRGAWDAQEAKINQKSSKIDSINFLPGALYEKSDYRNPKRPPGAQKNPLST